MRGLASCTEWGLFDWVESLEKPPDLQVCANSLNLVASFAAAAIAYGAAGALHGFGFLAVYLAALALGGILPAKPSIDAFHEGLAAVAEIGMFSPLGLLVFPSQLERNLPKAPCSP